MELEGVGKERRRELVYLEKLGSHGKRGRGFQDSFSSGLSIHIHTIYLFIELVSVDFVSCNKSLCCKELRHPLPIHICPSRRGLALSRVLGCSSIPGPQDGLRFIPIPQPRCGKDPLSTFAKPVNHKILLSCEARLS